MGNEGFEKILKEVLPGMGYQWRPMNRKNVRRKARRLTEAAGIHSWDAYLDLLQNDSGQREQFENVLRVTVTRFFRNAGVWEELAERIGRLALEIPSGSHLRAWSAGCAGGEEAYSLTMLLENLKKTGRLTVSWSILATDTDEASLNRTGNTVYEWGSIREVPEELRKAWFRQENDRWCLIPEAARNISFKHHDTLREAPPGGFNLVLLRNSVLTYNTPEVQARVVAAIGDAMEDRSLLVIGRKESLPPGAGFKELSDSIYRKL